jgi:hypothetical protein
MFRCDNCDLEMSKINKPNCPFCEIGTLKEVKLIHLALLVGNGFPTIEAKKFAEILLKNESIWNVTIDTVLVRPETLISAFYNELFRIVKANNKFGEFKKIKWLFNYEWQKKNYQTWLDSFGD